MAASPSLLQKLKKQTDLLLPFILLLLAAAAIFLTESRSGGFMPGGLYNGVPVHGLTLAKNVLNNDHPLFIYTSREIHHGKKIYYGYNRFPVFPFLLTGLLIHPFNNDIALQAYLARQLMNLFFFLSIIAAFRLLDNFLKNKFLALAIAVMSFSSFYMLSYHNIIFNDIPALLGFMIAFYAVVSAEKNKPKLSRILFYSIFPVSLGWQPYAVYSAWLLTDIFELLVNKKSSGKKFSNLFRQPSFIIFAYAVLFGLCVLGFQILNEWRITGGSFAALPSISSGLWRTGLTSSAGHTQYEWTFNWLIYLPQQAHTVTVNLIPFWPIFQVEPGMNASIFAAGALIIYIHIKYLKDRVFINKMQVIFILSGFCWTIPLKNFVALHEFQSIFYVGFTISFFILVLSRIDSRLWKLLAVNIVLAFLIAVSLSNESKVPNTSMNRLTPQFQKICGKLPSGSKIYFDGDKTKEVRNCRYAIDFFLGQYWYTELEEAEYAVTKNPNFPGLKLTSNGDFNLFKISAKPGKPLP